MFYSCAIYAAVLTRKRALQRVHATFSMSILNSMRLECPLSPGERPQILPIARLKPRNGSKPYSYWISVTKFFSGHTNIFMKIENNNNTV